MSQLELFETGKQLQLVPAQGFYVHKKIIATLEAEKKVPGATDRDKKKLDEEIDANKRAQIKG